MPKVTGLSHVVLRVHDLDRMVAFYREVLGLTITHERAGRMVFMTANPGGRRPQIATMTAGRGR